jgi:atypical dual specificity phosphatase
MTKNALYELRDFSIKGPGGLLLDRLDLVIPDSSVTMLLGPAGTGKSKLLFALSGNSFPPIWKVTGQLIYRNDPSITGGTMWVPQRRRGAVGRFDEFPITGSVSGWREAFRDGPAAILLDEPTYAEPGTEIETLVSLIREHKTAGGAAVIVTHDLEFARSVADRIVLIGSRRILANQPVAEFFSNSSDSVVVQFLRNGNCWPDPPYKPCLPPNFHWIIPGKLAGMAQPGLLRDIDEDLASIADAGVNMLVSLTEDPISYRQLQPFGISPRHFPITDMGVPAVRTTASLCRELEHAIEEGNIVAVHCRAGLGRTGLILASLLAWMGEDPRTAIDRIRSIAKGFIQNKAQENFVLSFAEVMGRR